MKTNVSQTKHNDLWVPQIAEVLDVKRETEAIVTIRIANANLGKSPLPGQFNMLTAFGVGEAPISFSQISPEDSTHTIKAVGNVTKALCALEPGEKIGVRGPFGSHWPIETISSEDDILIIAGGVGLAPVMPLIYQLIENVGTQNLTLLYGCRQVKDRFLLDDLSFLKERISVFETVDVAEKGWTGSVGVVTKFFNLIDINPVRTKAFICGPEIMMRFAAEDLMAREVDGKHIFVSMERNMKCAVGFCGHCQYGADFICKDGPVFDYQSVRDRMKIKMF